MSFGILPLPGDSDPIHLAIIISSVVTVKASVYAKVGYDIVVLHNRKFIPYVSYTVAMSYAINSLILKTQAPPAPIACSFPDASMYAPQFLIYDGTLKDIIIGGSQ